MRRRRDAGRSGVAMALMLLLLLAVQLLAHAAWVLAADQLRTARVSLDVAAARARARGEAVRAAAELGSGVPLPDSGRASGPGGWPDTGWSVRRIAREVWLVRAFAGGPAPQRSVLPLWIADPAARIAALRGRIVVGRGARALVGPGATVVDAGNGAAGCRWRPVLDSIAGSRRPPLFARLPGGVDALRLGLLGRAELRDAAGARLGAEGTPLPALVAGACASGPWNWGDPSGVVPPCARRSVARWAGADLRVTGGRGQGLLVVVGDLRLDGTRFRGVILAGGRVEVVGGARVRGVIVAAGGVEVDGASTVEADGCAAAGALDGVGGLRRAVPLDGGAWMDPG